MKIVYLMVMGTVFLLAGCAATTVQDVGIGMQIGSAAGSALGPYAMGLGLAAELTGKSMGRENSSKPGTPEFEKAQRSFFLLMSKGKILDNFESQVQITPETTPEQISIAARAVCADVDKLVLEKGSLKVSKKGVGPKLQIYMGAEEGDCFLIPIEKNPYGDKCVEHFETVGERFVKIAKKKERK